jgi:hypothetical protein
MKERILEKRKYILIDVPVNHVRLILWLTVAFPPCWYISLVAARSIVSVFCVQLL